MYTWQPAGVFTGQWCPELDCSALESARRPAAIGVPAHQIDVAASRLRAQGLVGEPLGSPAETAAVEAAG